MLGHPYADLLGMNVSSWDVGQATTTWPQPKGPAPAEAQIRTSQTEYRRADGSTMPVEITSYPLELDGRPVVFHSARDISARRKSEEEVRKLAFFDPLTELPNRRLLIQRLGETLSESTGTRVKGALLFIDLDNFKTVNDTAGHYEGDRLLVRVARTLVECVSRNDVVARIGGDEFVVLLARLGTDEGTVTRLADEVARRILNTLATSLGSGDGEYRASASIGVTLFDGEGEESAEAPLVRADVAMFAAKLAGRNTIRFFDPRMQAALSERAELETGLWTALEQRQFFLSYQAQVLASGEVIGLEALLRWRHPQRGLVSPASFIPLAEETGLIVPIGRWVLETACMQLARWAAEPARAGLPISVNVSARQILDDRFVDDVLEVLARTGADPGRLKLELTESSLLVDVEAVIGKMNMLKARGIGFSLDDFGTGYSSLAYLKRLPLEQLKIDQSFVRDILDDANDAEIARLVIMLAASLGLVVVAEGVETEAQREYLAGLGCERYQGYLFARPLPIAELEAFLAERDTVAAVAAGRCAGPEVARAGGRPALRAASTASSR
jgi:diguanylate cyclase (GGDEF)-like protein